jgi:hypothetical protein
MDDYSIQSLTESKNEWSARLVSILSHNIIQGIKSIFLESLRLCEESEEKNKYLMTFQNLLSKIPDWSSLTIETERKRIETVSGCKYLEDLITCVHIIQLKALTCIRVGLKQKKIDIDIPSIDKFIHKVYINVARKLYSNVYLFEEDIYPLQKQKNNRELELLVKEAILNTIRDNIPVEHILRVYIDETEEEEYVADEDIVKKEVDKLEKEKQLLEQERLSMQEREKLTTNNKSDQSNNADNAYDAHNQDDGDNGDNRDNGENGDNSENRGNGDNRENGDNQRMNLEIKETNGDKLEKIANSIENDNKKLSIDFSDIDSTINDNGMREEIVAPKDLDTLEKRAEQLKEKELDSNNSDDKLDIGNDIDIDLDSINLEDSLSMNDEIELYGIEELQ